MNWKITIFITALMSVVFSVDADTNGVLVAEIDGHKVNLPVTCDGIAGLLNAFSDFDANGKSDIDGDGIHLTLGGFPAAGKMLGVFNIQGQEYKFVHKGEFSLEKLVVDEMNVNRRDGSTYKIKIDLTCN